MQLFAFTFYESGHMLDSISVSNSVDGRELPIYLYRQINRRLHLRLTRQAFTGKNKVNHKNITIVIYSMNKKILVGFNYWVEYSLV